MKQLAVGMPAERSGDVDSTNSGDDVDSTRVEAERLTAES